MDTIKVIGKFINTKKKVTRKQDDGERWCVEFADGGPVIEVYTNSKFSRNTAMTEARKQLRESHNRYANGRIVRAYKLRQGEPCRKIFN